MTDARIIGLLAYFSLAEQQRLAKDSSLSPSANVQIALAAKSALAYQNFDQIQQLAEQQKVDLPAQMDTYLGLTEQLEARLRPTDWYERLVKSYVTLGVLADFNEHLHFFLSKEAKKQLGKIQWDCGQGTWAVPYISEVCQAQPRVSARLSLWGRRVLGDVVSTLRQALANYPDVLGGNDPRGLENLTAKIRQNHQARMEQVGLRG